ncbi:MAG: carbohydrate porin [Caulobacteraceae bacterium]
MSLRRIIAGLGASLRLLASPTWAQTISDPTGSPAPPATRQGEGASLTFTAAYVADTLSNVAGGEATGARYLDLVKLSAAYGGSASRGDGPSGVVSIEHVNGANLSGQLVGADQTITSIEASPEAFRLYEAWLQKELLGGRLGVKAGIIDLNTTYDVQEAATLFLNSSHGIGPELGRTGLNGPSIFPTPALAVNTVWRPAGGWTAQLGVLNGVAGDPSHPGRFVAIEFSPRDGALIVAQVERRCGDALRLEAGAWTYTSAFNALDRFDAAGAPRRIGGNAGVYALAEGSILARSQGAKGGLGGWVRAGLANEEINPIESYLGAGLVYTGLGRGRDKDQAGLAIARAAYGAPARVAAARAGIALGGAETVVEATYRYLARDWLSVQPDLQYVVHPGGRLSVGDALVIGVRLAATASR